MLTKRTVEFYVLQFYTIHTIHTHKYLRTLIEFYNKKQTKKEKKKEEGKKH